ncbi:MAG: hypothetical protein E7256_02910 [Lachnospiraceae bacterium]|nr:hypothetical protein [Lachnospiraceae bacterium]
MSQVYPIKNTAVVTYSYVIDPDRPLVIKQVEDSVCNSLYIEKLKCKKPNVRKYKTYAPIGTLSFNCCLRRIRSSFGIRASVDGIRYVTVSWVNRGRVRRFLLITGEYTMCIRYIDGRLQRQKYYERKTFLKAMPLNNGCKEIKELRVESFKIINILKRENRLYIETQMKLQSKK